MSSKGDIPLSKKPKRKPASTTGTGKGALVDQSNWRVKMQGSRIKFDDDLKDKVCKELARHGMKVTAATAAGVTPDCVRKHLDIDPDFAKRYAIAIGTYHDKILKAGMECALEGAVSKRFDKDGKLIDSRVEQSIPILMMEMKRVEKDYRDKPIVDVTALGGGVLLAPSGQAPIDWVKAQAETNEMKEVNGRDGEDTDG